MQIKMLKAYPIGKRRMMRGESVTVDDKTAAILILAKVAEPDESPQQYQRGDMTAELINAEMEPAPKKRAYKRRDMKAK